MSDFALFEIAPLAASTPSPSWVVDDVLALMRRDSEELAGNHDFVDSTATYLRGYHAQRDVIWVDIVAVTGLDATGLPTGRSGLPQLSYDADACPLRGDARVLGVVCASAPTEDNLRSANVWAVVDPAERGRGVGTALADAGEAFVTGELGRTVLLAWSSHQPPKPGEEQLMPPPGFGPIPVDDVARFALGRGWSLEQGERHSILTLPVAESVLEPLWAEAVTKSAGYSLRQFGNHAPDDLAEPLVRLLNHFSIEAPLAGLDLEEENWTVERLRRGEEQRTAGGKRVWVTVAVHDATGEVAATTEISCPTRDGQHEFGFQNVTVVDAAHRGHRLGYLVKIANVRALQHDDPDRRRIHTWNAGENRWMLKINDDLGFVPGLAEAAWQKKVG